MIWHISEIPHTQVPLDLLLLADPSETKIRQYLPQSRCFVISDDKAVCGVCAVQELEAGVYELKSIAVDEARQQSGAGTALLQWLIDALRQSGATRLEVGTGTFGFQLAFYQKLGFRVSAIDRDFFLRNYEAPIYENGIQHLDMLRLSLPLKPSEANID